METQPVKDMIAYMSSNPVLEGAPTINQLSWVNNMEFTKPEAGQQKDPFIVFGEIDWQEGKRDGTLEHWKANVDSSKNESGCFTYGVSKKDDSPNTLYTLEMYPNEQYLWDVHCNTEAIKETIAQTKHLRTNVKLNKLKLHGGYAYKNK
jgi:quinol monooxygenase YgiN